MYLLRRLSSVSSMTLISRIFGLWRDLLVAKVFGASAFTDAFFVAFRMPNFLRRLLAEGAFSQAFVPALNEYRYQHGDEVRALINRTATLLFSVLLLITLIGVVFAPALVHIWAPGFHQEPEKFRLTVLMVRITFPYILFISLTALATAIVNTWGRFSMAAFAPTFLNLSFILMILFRTENFTPNILVLAWAVPIGGLLQLLALGTVLARLNLLPRWQWSIRDKGVRRILKLMGPIAIGSSAAQIGQLINTIFASFLVSGSVTWLYCAERLMEFPVGLFGAAMSSILLPALSQIRAQGKDPQPAIEWSLHTTLLVALPGSLIMIFCAIPLTSTLFYRGEFSVDDLLQTQKAVVAYGIGLTALLLLKILGPMFYANQDVRTPLKVSLIVLLITQILNLLLIGWLHHTGLALAISLAAWCNVLLLYRSWLKRGGAPVHGQLGRFLLRMLPAIVVLICVLLWLSGSRSIWLTLSSWERILRLSGILLAACGSYGLTLWLSGFRFRQFSGKL